MNLNEIVYKNFIKNTGMLASIGMNLVGYFCLDILFPKYSGVFIDNIDKLDWSHLVRALSPLIASQALFYGSDSIYSKASVQFNDDILNDILGYILTSDIIPVNKVDLLKNIFQVFDIQNILHLLVAYFIPTLMISIALLIYFTRVDKTLGFTFLGIFLTSILILYVYMKKSVDYGKEKDLRHMEYINELDDLFTNLHTIHFDHMNQEETSRIKSFKERIMSYYVTSHDINKQIKFIVSVVSLIILFTLSTMLISLYKKDKISKGELVSYIYLVLLLLQYYDITSYEVDTLLNYMSNYNQSMNYFSQFRKTNVSESYVNDLNIEIKNIRIPTRNVYIPNCEIEEGKVTGVVGDIGTGKSTLIKCMMKLIPYEGTITLGGQDIQTIDIYDHIAYIPQRIDFFNRSLYENITYGLDVERPYVEEKIDMYGLRDFINVFPNGLDTVVTKHGENISGGQKQILYLLKTLLSNKKVVVMDEPTASLSKEYKQIFLNLLGKMDGKTVIIVTHDKELYPYFDNKIIL
jgi:ABC-type bacteriocin/lantibiotic exporter with double-glycine peptidase domain